MKEISTLCFQEFPVLKTDRLTLREIRESDASEIFDMRTNDRVNQFMARPEMGTMDDSVQLIKRTNEAYANKQGIGWAGILRDNNAIIGTCGFNSIDYPNLHAEIGGELSVDYWGKNIAVEAVSAIVNFGIHEMNLHTIEAKVSPENRGAIFLLEHLGFKKEAHYRDRVYNKGQYMDLAVYSIINAH